MAARIIRAKVVLEYAAGAATVGVGWSGHFVSLLSNFGITIPPHLAASPTQWCTAIQVQQSVAGCAHSGLNFTGAWLNLPAVFIVVLMSTILRTGYLIAMTSITTSLSSAEDNPAAHSHSRCGGPG